MLIDYIVVALGVPLIFIGWNIMVDFAKQNEAMELLAGGQGRIATELEGIAQAIRDPQQDTASQGAADAIADRITAAAGALNATADAMHGLADEERALDTANAVIEEPPVADEPVAEEPAPE